MPSQVLNFSTHYQTLLKSFPYIRFLTKLPLKIFGCTTFVHIHSQNHSKLDPKAIKCIFLGYSSNQKGYKCYSPITQKFYNTMDVTFLENQPFFKADIQGRTCRNVSFYGLNQYLICLQTSLNQYDLNQYLICLQTSLNQYLICLQTSWTHFLDLNPCQTCLQAHQKFLPT